MYEFMSLVKCFLIYRLVSISLWLSTGCHLITLAGSSIFDIILLWRKHGNESNLHSSSSNFLIVEYHPRRQPAVETCGFNLHPTNIMEDLEIVAKQTGTAILDFDGKVLKATGELALLQDASASVTLSALYHILQDATKCLENDSPRKISVVYSDHNFVLTTTDKNICIAKIQTN